MSYQKCMYAYIFRMGSCTKKYSFCCCCCFSQSNLCVSAEKEREKRWTDLIRGLMNQGYDNSWPVNRLS